MVSLRHGVLHAESSPRRLAAHSSLQAACDELLGRRYGAAQRTLLVPMLSAR
jgi:hypothetical protein